MEREGTPNSGSERAGFALLAVLATAYVVARAWAVPFVNDEARTFFLFNEVGRFQPWYAYWDAANHLLCTALGQVCYLIFGPAAWSLRLPSVLSFGVYLWYVWRLGVLLVHRPVRWVFWLAMLFTPVLIEFFSLYRGYGMGIAFLLMAVFHLIRYARTGERLHFLGALAGMLLAAYASFTLMILWSGILVLLALMALRTEGRGWRLARMATAWTILGAMPLCYLASYGLDLAKRGALYSGTSGGLVRGSMPSVLWPMFHVDPHLPFGLLVLCLIGLIVHGSAGIFRRERWKWPSPLEVLAMLMCMEIAGRYVLNITSGILFPTDRAALHFVPLIAMLFAFTVDEVSVKRPWAQGAMAFLLIFPWSTWREADLDHSAIWPDDAIGEDLFPVAEKCQQAANRPLAIGSPGFLDYSWALRNMAVGSDLPIVQNVKADCRGVDLLLLRVADTIHAPEYHRIAGMPTDPVVLLARNTPLPLELLLDTVIPPENAVPEFRNLWEPPEGSVHAAGLLLVLDAQITSPARPLEAVLVWDTGSSDRPPHAYTDMKLALQRTTWQGDTLRLAHWIPLPDGGAEHIDMRIWNVRRQKLALGHCRLRVYRVMDA
jgi:hypothetical protein